MGRHQDPGRDGVSVKFEIRSPLGPVRVRRPNEPKGKFWPLWEELKAHPGEWRLVPFSELSGKTPKLMQSSLKKQASKVGLDCQTHVEKDIQGVYVVLIGMLKK